MDTGTTRLLAWLSPSFPVGAFAYSHGLETAVDRGLVGDRATLERWVEGVLRYGAGRTDALLFLHVHAAVLRGDEAAFLWALERADALRPSSELALESRSQGEAFLATVAAAWPLPGLAARSAAVRAAGRPCAYPVAVALATALAGIEARRALAAHLHAFAANLVSAGVRVVPLGQTDGQKALARLDSVVHDAVLAAAEASIDDLGSASPQVDWVSMLHETQYTRLFRS